MTNLPAIIAIVVAGLSLIINFWTIRRQKKTIEAQHKIIESYRNPIDVYNSFPPLSLCNTCKNYFPSSMNRCPCCTKNPNTLRNENESGKGLQASWALPPEERPDHLKSPEAE